MQILKGHLSIKPVRSLAFSPDGSKLASSARDYKTFLWDLSTGKYQMIVDRQSYTVAFSPDGKILATGQPSDVTLWFADTGELRVIDIAYDGSPYTHVAFSADARTMILVGSTIRTFAVDSGKELPAPGFARAEAQRSSSARAMTPDCRRMATGHERPRKCVRLWDVDRCNLQDEISGPTASVTALAFSPRGRYLAAAAGTTLWVWDAASKEVVLRHTINSMHYKDVAFTPDGRWLVFARNDATVRLIDTTTWAEAAAFDFEIGPMISVACSPDGMRAAGGSGKGKIVVWDIDL